MIPITADRSMFKEIKGGIYYAHPPIGEIEVQLVQMMSQGDGRTNAAYLDAKDKVDKELKGQRHPPEKEYQEMITKKAMEYLEKETESNLMAGIDQINGIIDLTMYDWDHSKTEIGFLKNISFPKKEKPKADEKEQKQKPVIKPSALLPLGIKRAFVDWYETQFELTVEESKN